MTPHLNRYAGAQPFADTELSRKTFFGREEESAALTDQILANRLVVVYAKSGTGKSSLLNAGVAPRLREADSIPLLVRLNDTKSTLLRSVFERIREEAARQQVEYVSGDSSSLWAFFKTTEFWRDDLLLKPVLVLDQFEELFTFWGEEVRDQFLSELNFVIRGIAPPDIVDTYSHTAPTAHIVISLREDFLGMLEEASDRIPQIMDHRFRVAALTVSAAKRAITGPAQVEAPNVATKPFHLDPAFVDSVMDHLTKSSSGRRISGRPQIEPFHLQLICQRIEKVAALKQQTSCEQAVLSSKDFGDANTFSDTLAAFYEESIHGLSNGNIRTTARRLCEQYLISPEGRRLSLEQREVQRQLGMSQDALSELVERRLLRTDRRSESIYYELSHDLLVEPVLASRRVQVIFLSWVTIIAGAMMALTAAAFLPVFAYMIYRGLSNREDYPILVGGGMLTPGVIAVGVAGIFWFRSGTRSRRRYSVRPAAEMWQPLPTRLGFKHRIWGWLTFISGSSLFGFVALASLYYLFTFLVASSSGSDAPSWISQDFVQDTFDRPLVELSSAFAEMTTLLVVGWLCLRKGIRTLWPYEFTSQSGRPTLAGPRSFAILGGKFIVGGYALLDSALSCFAFINCVSAWHGNIPGALRTIISTSVLEACTPARAHDWLSDATFSPVSWALAIIGSVMLIRSGFSDLRNLQRAGVFFGPVRGIAAAAMVTMLIVALTFYWKHSLAASDHPDARLSEPPIETKASGNQEPAQQFGFIVGNKGTILHTSDGRGWSIQKSATTAPLFSVFVDMPESSWAGNGEVLLHTVDNGMHWESQDARSLTLGKIAIETHEPSWNIGETAGVTFRWHVTTSYKFEAGTLVTPEIGFAVGDNGTISRTDDSGANLTGQNSGTKRRLAVAAFVNRQSGWVVGDMGTILHTEDGGRKWKSQNSGTLRNLQAIACVSPQSCWVVGQKGAVLHTTDGTHWNNEQSGVRADLNDVIFTTELSGWAVGAYGTILHTTDAGQTWQSQMSGVVEELNSITFAKQWGSIGITFDPFGQRTRIRAVNAGGPAEEAGLKTGDTITSLNGRPVSNVTEFVRGITVFKPGTDVIVGYHRNGRPLTAHVTVGDRSKLFSDRSVP